MWMGWYFYNKVDFFVVETADFLGVGDPAVEIFHFLLSDLLLVELFGQPFANEGLRFFEGYWVGVVDEDGQFGDSVGDDGDACAHLACPDHSE